MSVKYEGKRYIGRKCKVEFLANNEFKQTQYSVYGNTAIISVLQRNHPGIPFLDLLYSHPEINLFINWVFSC